MTITQLRYIVALDQFKSFAKAAEHCLVAQPTLSLQIQKVEQELGFDLFDRKKNPIITTKLGKEVVEQAKSTLKEADKLYEIAGQWKDEPAGNISLGIIPTVSNYLIPSIYKKLQSEFPKVNFRISELPTLTIIEKLESEEIDLGILATPLKISNIVEHQLYYEPFVVYYPKDAKEKSTSVSMKHIEKYPLLILGEEHCFRHQSLKICNRNALAKIESGSVETLKRMVDMGIGVTLLPKLAVDKVSERIVPFQSPEPAREISLVYKKGFYKTKILNKLTNLILNVIPKEYHKKEKFKVIGVSIGQD
ncbi:hydrogen peroxide-inducible genes activator [Leptospira levettii]|uniref:Hydrogen peroxide-inducible genes activator n=1 Tax=Leptospira levettii TaxID=2023178 RepID=A0ABY2MPM6_9LEPT|nr:hydrogen peroxide-inducible genes activator [Leptospira levettii]TGL71607.1 hydrogen peroxide-inducible genes activator [Leptospira levettii]TGM29984.1 hydrogen peroxide-inducible genes activator [Leptospira levettii]